MKLCDKRYNFEMPPPTLLRKGFLIPPKNASASLTEKMNNTVPIEYILDFLNDMTPSQRGGEPRKKAKHFGEKVIVLKSSTGSGKSTALPANLFKRFGTRVGKNFVITQPRVLTAIDIATGIPNNEPSIILDVNIGYSTGNFKRLPREKGIIFCTVGTVTQQLTAMTAEEFMKRNAFIMIDEVHDRSLEVDTCLFLLKKLLMENYSNKECPIVILMSATFDETTFMRYFEVPSDHYIQVEGQTYHKEVHFPMYNITDTMKYASLMAQKLHLEGTKEIRENNVFRDILVFVHTNAVVHELAMGVHRFNSRILNGTVESIKEMDERLASMLVSGGSEKMYALPVELTSASFSRGGLDYQNLFAEISNVWLPLWKDEKQAGTDSKPDQWVKAVRRIIFATNIAETGVTIETLKYCIDTGYVKSVEFNPELDCSLLLDKNVTQGMAVQRKGRVGRKAPGDWYPVFTESTLGKLQENQFPNIIVEDVSNVILSIILQESKSVVVPAKKGSAGWKRFRLNDPTLYCLEQKESLRFDSLDFIEFPSADSLNYACQKLFALGYIDFNYQITPFGFYANQIRFMSLEAKRMVFSGFIYNVSILDLITIAVIVEVGKKPIKPGKKWKMPSFIPDQEYYFENVIRDTFIEFLCVVESFREQTAIVVRDVYKQMTKSSTSSKPIKFDCKKRLIAWCEKHQISMEGMLAVMEKRDEYINGFVEVGIDIFHGHGISILEHFRNNLQEGLDYVKAIKKCIRDGYGMRLLKWNPISQTYQAVQRKINVSLTIRNAIYVICNSFTVMRSHKGFFEVMAGDFYSVMDNFAEIDETLYT